MPAKVSFVFVFVDVLKNIILLQLKISHLAHQISRIIINLSLYLIDDAGQFVPLVTFQTRGLIIADASTVGKGIYAEYAQNLDISVNVM